MKAEGRGKFPGVKLHLEADEVEIILGAETDTILPLTAKMRKKIRALMEEDPDLLSDRSPERVAAILVKEVEKAKLQLETLQATGQFEKLDAPLLQERLLKYVPKK